MTRSLNMETLNLVLFFAAVVVVIGMLADTTQMKSASPDIATQESIAAMATANPTTELAITFGHYKKDGHLTPEETAHLEGLYRKTKQAEKINRIHRALSGKAIHSLNVGYLTAMADGKLDQAETDHLLTLLGPLENRYALND